MKIIKRKFLKFLIKSNIFYCPICGNKNHSFYNRPCNNCRKKMNFIPDNFCYGCGGELDGALAICSKCLKEKKRNFLKAISIMPYQQFNRELILSYKHGKKIELARFFAHHAANKLRRLDIEFDLVVAIPLHWVKKHQRGFNQSEILAQLIAQNLDKEFSNSALKRPKKAQQQKQLNSVERHKNLRNAFKANSKIVSDKTILLVDDVFTTGATVDNAARILKKSGATTVYVLTIARA